MDTEKGTVPQVNPPSLLRPVAELGLKHMRIDPQTGTYFVVEEKTAYGVVTDAFVNYIVVNLQTEESTFGDFKFHASGTGTAAEAAGDTAMDGEVESRDTGSQAEGSSSNIYKTIATHTYAGSFTIVEHGVFSIGSGGTLMDRTLFGGIVVGSADKIEFTYNISFPSGG